MSNLLVTPELVAAAAADLAGIGSAIGAANAAAGAPTMALLAAGADEVSAAVAAVFSSYAQQYQALSAAAAAFHDQFVRALAAGAGAYAGAEAANVEQQLLNAINAPTLALLGRPLIGNGADGAAGTGQAGGAGGLLYGNGGNGGSGAAPGGLLEQAVAVEEAIDTAAANQLMNNVPQALQQLAQPTKSIWPFDQLSELWKAISPHLSPLSNIVSMLNNHVSMTNSGVSMASTLHSMLKGFAPAAAQAVETAAQNGVQAMSSLGSQLGSSLGSSGLGAGVAANLGRAASVGSLSVPQAWAAANQAVTPAARALPLTSLTSAAQTAPGHMLGGLPLGHSVNAGSGINNALRVPARAYAIPRTPAAG